ncbi:DNA repair protein RecO [Paraclostridium bifermentans]|jgi:DNA repair protein RecO (recombination protein O)|uniref:DNA repair protein RecO n=1 Tax=Paraclostridium bifermentans ATCC 638 = DSM 14991 TaxID=1233171 RepID=T4VME5_PARBF|nr:DNA repair protein RecO [Paraclostridium bifermentans]MDU7904435.1 DNA repair protein RecO [Peptostreptococcaceae bacterium]EQK41946.1 DNA repair protein RecO [[Clostridium] bifermentans ATCC 638] [Paraclostridium bifermentans ATCC 638 = DSM 14991]MBS5953414.1 DNA repair protein RecO [Paraclostridium bifermentans]MBU5288396.1 DNA repair protein RecO [Paraclostridium bifermentans]RIZ59262.1 DNA repair protein RecO [Paraclostridium bifermentans]
MIIVNTQGIVLRSARYKENDLILTIFTRKLGKISAIAKGAKRNKSSLLSSSQVFSYSNFTLKKQGNMYRVSQSETIKNFYDIAYDIEAFSYATYITSLVDGSIYENQTNNRLFVLLAQTLYLYTQNEVDKEYITRAFELKFLDYTGFKPIVNRCVNCNTTNLKSSVFNVDEGGILCEKCKVNHVYNFKIDSTTIKLMDYIFRNDILTCSKAKVSKYLVNELTKILKVYVQVYVDNANTKSLHLLQGIENNKGADIDD